MAEDDEMIHNEMLGIDELHDDVTALDAKIAAAHKDEMSDSEKAALDKLIDERNEAYKQHHVNAPAE